MKNIRSAAVAAFSISWLIFGSAQTAQARVEAGMLTCEVSGGFAFIFSSPRNLHCVFHKANGQTEAYGGRLGEFGLDVGVSGRGVIAWGVIADTTDLPPGELAGDYGGVEAGAAAIVGGTGRAMIGGSGKTVTLQPLSVEGRFGLNIAVGVESMELFPLFRVSSRTSHGQVPAVGLRNEAVAHAHKVPHYGCGSYTHLQRGQTLSGLAHACGVTLESLLDANPQITNVREISAGALVHLPAHVGHHAASPCGDRAVLQDQESLDHVAWRCGVTLHALLVSNPTVRDMDTVRPGLVLAVPERGSAPSGPPVRYAARETETDMPAASGQPRPARTTNVLRDQERTCVRELADTLGVAENTVRVTGRDVGHNDDALIYVSANGTRAACEIDEALNVRSLTRLRETARATTAPATAAPRSTPQRSSGSNRLNEICLNAVANETNNSAVSVLGSEFSEANSLVMVGVGAQRAPWKCLISNDGVVAELTFEGDDGAGVPDLSASDVSGSAIEACLVAVARETREGEVTILSTEYSEANSLVMVGVGAQRAPWKCLVSNDGIVAEVSFEGDDNAGVQDAAASNVSGAAVDACLTAVSRETNESDTAVLSSEFSEANSLVMVGVGSQRAPWRCLVSNDGQVAEIGFAGTEGKL